jgi:hypothetical protein
MSVNMALCVIMFVLVEVGRRLELRRERVTNIVIIIKPILKDQLQFNRLFEIRNLMQVYKSLLLLTHMSLQDSREWLSRVVRFFYF